uniref:F-box protein 7 n=1 Tax=Amphilophus citrinellus TaxID=61819 RepID=A0A3Q0RTQ0_AMPCI
AAVASTTSAPSTSSTHTAANSSTNQSPAVLTESQESCETSDSEPSAAVWEPMLCSEAEDGQAPHSLEVLYHTAQATNPNDAIMVAGHLLMLETGFIPQGSELKPGEMPAGWRCAGGVYRLQYTHPLCESSLASVVAVCMGPMLVINKHNNEGIRSLTYITTLLVSEHLSLIFCVCRCSGGSAAAAFKELSKLSRLFKDQLAYPLIATAREAMALPVAFGLPALPPELLLRVLRLLDVRSVVRLSAVSRHFNAATADSSLWRHLYRRDFSGGKRVYKNHYKNRKSAHPFSFPRYHPRYLPPFHDRDIFRPLPFPHFPPGIIGGEHDQRPTLPHGLLPRPRHDPIGPLAEPHRRPPDDFHRIRPAGGRPADVRRGFI